MHTPSNSSYAMDETGRWGYVVNDGEYFLGIIKCLAWLAFLVKQNTKKKINKKNK